MSEEISKKVDEVISMLADINNSDEISYLDSDIISGVLQILTAYQEVRKQL